MPRLTSLLLLASAFGASAQQRPLPAQPSQIQLRQPTAPSTTPSPDQPKDVRLEFPGSDVKDVLALYGRLTGKKIITDNSVTGPVNIVINDPVTRDEAIKIIETALLLNQFSIVPGDGDILKVVGTVKNPRIAGIPIISELDQLPAGDQVVTFLIKLHFADATEIAQTLQQYVVASLYTAVLPLPKSQAILVTESTPVLRSLISVIKDLDQPPAQVVSEFIQLERADASDVVDKLQSILAPDTGTTGGQVQRGPRPPGVPNGGQGGGGGGTVSVTATGSTTLSEDSIIVGKVRLTADERTNRIQVVTRPINMPIIRGLITGFDSDAGFQAPFSRVLKYVDVSKVFPVIQTAISEPQSDTAQARQNQNQQAQPARTPTPTTSAGTTAGGGTTGGVSISEELQTTPKDDTLLSATVGNTKLIADPRKNAIIVIGTKEMQKRVSLLIAELDVPAPQVLLNTVIGELTLNKDYQFGVNYLLGKGISKPLSTTTSTNGTTTSTTGGVTTTTGTGTNSTTGTSTTGGLVSVSAAGVPSINFPTIFTASNIRSLAPLFVGGASGLSGFVTAGDTLGALVTALDSTSQFRIVQRPMVFTSNNKKAIIASGQQIAVPTQSLANVNTTDTASVQTSIEYKDVVLQLEVVPLINSDGEVSLDILQKLDSLTGSSTTIGANVVPTIATRYVKTNVSVPNGATIILGGLITQNNTKTTSGIPILGRLPGIGALFRTTTNNRDRSELIILMRPQVVKESHDAVDLTDHEQQRLHIEPDLESTLDADPEPAKRPKIKPAAQPTLR